MCNLGEDYPLVTKKPPQCLVLIASEFSSAKQHCTKGSHGLKDKIKFQSSARGYRSDRYLNNVDSGLLSVKSSESIAAGWKLCKSHLQACGVSHFYFRLRALGLGCGLTCFSIHFSFFFFFLCVCAADFLRSCMQGWWWCILPSWALKFGKKKKKQTESNWADICILVVHRLKGNCLINLFLFLTLSLKLALATWTLSLLPYPLSTPAESKAFSLVSLGFLSCHTLSTSSYLNAAWSSLCFHTMRVEWYHLSPTRLRTSVSLDHLWYFPQIILMPSSCSKMCCSISFSAEASCQAVWKSVPFKIYQVSGNSCLKTTASPFMSRGARNSCN